MILNIVICLFQSVGAPSQFFSYAIAAYSAGALFGAPIWGKLFDRWKKAKLLSIIGILFVLFGSLLYTIQSKYSILLGRFVAGIGTGLEGAIIGMAAKAAKPKNKAKQITIFYALKQLGIICGPGKGIYLIIMFKLQTKLVLGWSHWALIIIRAQLTLIIELT